MGYLVGCDSPNHEGVEGTDRDVVWMLTDASAILFMCASLMEVVLFFLLKEAHFYPCSLQVTSRCASRGLVIPITFCWEAIRGSSRVGMMEVIGTTFLL